MFGNTNRRAFMKRTLAVGTLAIVGARDEFQYDIRPGFKNCDSAKYVVYLDGEIPMGCVAADPRTGRILCYEHEKNDDGLYPIRLAHVELRGVNPGCEAIPEVVASVQRARKTVCAHRWCIREPDNNVGQTLLLTKCYHLELRTGRVEVRRVA